MGARVGNSSVAGIVRPARNDARNSMIRADELAEIERSQIAGVDEVSGQLAPQECVRPRRTYVEPALPAIEAKRGNALCEILRWDYADWKRKIGSLDGVCTTKKSEVAKRRPVTLQGFQERRSSF